MTSSNRDYSEKRDFIRMRVDADVTLLSAGQVIPATCVDLSASGMQVRLPQRFQVATRLEVQIQSDLPALSGLCAQTEVVWIADLPDGQQRLGLRILELK